MSNHNIDFYEDLTKISFQLSNTHLISSSASLYQCYLNQTAVSNLITLYTLYTSLSSFDVLLCSADLFNFKVKTATDIKFL